MKLNNKSIKIILLLLIFISLSLGIAYASGAFLGGSNEVSLTKGLVGHWKLDEESTIDFTINEYSYPTFDTSNSNGGWSHWGRSGAIGSYSQNTNKDYIFNKSNTYSHKVSNGPSATGEYLLYQSPSIEGITNRSLSAIVKLSDGSQVTNDKIFPAWNAITSGSIPNNMWTLIEYLGDGFYLCKAEGIKQDGSNDLVGIYVSPGIEAYFSIVQLEQKTYSSSFINGARNGTVDDRSGYSNKGINYGAILTNGIKGESKGALSFDGINDYIEYDDDDNLFNSLPISFSIWFYQDGTRSGDLINKYYSSSVNGYSITLSPTGGIRLYYFKDASNYIESYNGYYGQPILNSWNHVVVNVDENNAKIYLNNNLIVTKNWVGTFGKPTTNQKLSLGRYPGSTNVYSNNIISDVRIYNRALSAEEIKLLYDSYKPQTTIGNLNKGLVAHYPLDGKYETKDITSYENHGTNNGATLTTGRKGEENGAYLFNPNNYNKILSSVKYNNYEDFSISSWIYPLSHDGSQFRIIFGNVVGNNIGSGLVIYSNKLCYHDYTTHSDMNYCPTNDYIELNKWQLVTLSYGNGNLKIYRNGIKVYENIITRTLNSNNFLIGGSYSNDYSGARFFNGSISDVRIYNRALSAEEIKLLYDSYKPQATVASSSSGLVLDMPLTSSWIKTETLGSEVITDKTPYSNNGQNSNAILSNEGASLDGSGTVDGTIPGDNIIIPEDVTNTNNYPNGCTYSIWLYVDTDAVDRMSLFYGASTIRHIEIYSSSKYFRTEAARQNGYSFGTSSFPDDVRGKWSHFMIVFANDETNRPVRWYQNGKLFYTGSLDGGSYPGTEYFSFNRLGRSTGTTSYLYARSFDGKLSNLKVYNKALSDEEVKLLYEKGRY